MLRSVALHSSNDSPGSVRNASISASTPCRCACSTSNRAIIRSNTRSRGRPVAGTAANAAWSASSPNRSRNAVLFGNRTRTRARSSPASPHAPASVVSRQPINPAVSNTAANTALSKSLVSMVSQSFVANLRCDRTPPR